MNENCVNFLILVLENEIRNRIIADIVVVMMGNNRLTNQARRKHKGDDGNT